MKYLPNINPLGIAMFYSWFSMSRYQTTSWQSHVFILIYIEILLTFEICQIINRYKIEFYNFQYKFYFSI